MLEEYQRAMVDVLTEKGYQNLSHVDRPYYTPGIHAVGGLGITEPAFRLIEHPSNDCYQAARSVMQRWLIRIRPQTNAFNLGSSHVGPTSDEECAQIWSEPVSVLFWCDIHFYHVGGPVRTLAMHTSQAASISEPG